MKTYHTPYNTDNYSIFGSQRMGKTYNMWKFYQNQFINTKFNESTSKYEADLK